MNFKAISIAATLTVISLISLTAPAKATAYRNTNIYLELKEGGLNVNDGPSGPLGTATYKRGSWTGSITPVTGGIIPLPKVLDAQGNVVEEARKLYVGTFSETNSSGKTCTGDVTILRHSQGQGMGANLARMTRTITGGNSLTACVSGTTTVEGTGSPRPSPNSAGNFTTVEANTLKTNTATWWRWKTVGPTVCKNSPTSLSSVPVPSATELNARFGTGSANQIVSSGGNPWLKVNKPDGTPGFCYVRANISDIQAVLLNF